MERHQARKSKRSALYATRLLLERQQALDGIQPTVSVEEYSAARDDVESAYVEQSSNGADLRAKDFVGN